MNEINKNKTLAIVFWILSAAVAVIIFILSNASGEESADLSHGLLAFIVNLLGNFIDHNTLRKIAHFCEYAALGFCTGGALKFTRGRLRFFNPLLICIPYSVSDEIHQYFVPGRACRLFDVFVDTCGSIVGIAVLIAFLSIIAAIIRKKADR